MRIIIDLSTSHHHTYDNFDFAQYPVHTENINHIAQHILYLVDLNHLAADPFQEAYSLNHHIEDYQLSHLTILERNLISYLGNGTSHLPIDRFIGNPIQFRCPTLGDRFNSFTFICSINLAFDDSFVFHFKLTTVDQQQTGERTLAEETP